jgi:redox-sensing transcriptional repressor
VAKQKIPAAPSVRRLPGYLQAIRQLQGEGGGYISATQIARELNLEPIQVRKDLAITGIMGKPKRGYPAEALGNAIKRFLGWDEPREAVLVGAGNLGAALLGYGELRSHGLVMGAAFDSAPEKAGTRIHGVPVFPLEALEAHIRRTGVKIAVLTVPPPAAQETAELLARAGIEGIWNFTSVKLKLGGRVAVQREDLSSGYALLCVMMRAGPGEDHGDRPEGAV